MLLLSILKFFHFCNMINNYIFYYKLDIIVRYKATFLCISYGLSLTIVRITTLRSPRGAAIGWCHTTPWL